MLSYDEALSRILDSVDPLARETVPVSEALGRALAEPIAAPENLPPFDNSAVDGYAVRYADTQHASGDRAAVLQLHPSQTQFAGEPSGQAITEGSNVAIPIMTGGVLPPGADAIVMVEDTDIGSDGSLYLSTPASPSFIRRTGSDVRRGQTVLLAGDVIDAGVIGLLSALGFTRAPCFSRPRIGILSTGSELVPASTRSLPPAHIRDSNGPALEAAVLLAGGIVEARQHVADDKQRLRDAIQSMSQCDVIISSGGVSVGEADFVKQVLEELGTLDLWRIAIKPGKPLAFGRIGNALFFGLPGNPVSSLVTFELFVRPVLKKLAGHRNLSRPRITATLSESMSHEPGRREFVRARIEYRDGEAMATPTGAQGSHRLSSLTGADALLVAREERGDYVAGERLPALLLV